MEYGLFSLVPPVLAILIAFKTKKAELAMFIGVFLGAWIMASWNPFTGLAMTVDSIIGAFSNEDNLKIIIFTSLMGAFVSLLKLSGGMEGFINYLIVKNQHVRSKRAAIFLTYFIGLMLFIDGLMGIMFKGALMLPIYDKFKISREKLAFVSNATSAPVNALFVLNSWGAFILGLIGVQISAGYLQGEASAILFKSLPFEFYSIGTLLFIPFLAITGKDWGPMKKAELRVQTTGKLLDDGAVPVMKADIDEELGAVKGKENKNNMLIPMAILIGCAFAGLFITGRGNLLKGDGTTSVMYAVMISLSYMAISYSRQKIMTTSQFVHNLGKGVYGMFSLAILLILSFSLGDIISSLGTGPYLASLTQNVHGAFTPVIVFILSILISFATGTSWGTFSIMIPIGVSMAASMGGNVYMVIGAVLSGGVFGDQTSPISDCAILASSTSGTDLIAHTKTQLAYALPMAIAACVLYVIFGFVLPG